MAITFVRVLLLVPRAVQRNLPYIDNVVQDQRESGWTVTSEYAGPIFSL